ncbi:CBS domain-containing protein [Roseivivax sp. CAU 1761]
MLVQQILKNKADDSVVTVTPDTLIRDAAKLLAEKRIGTVVVSKDGRTPEGILSERDIVRMLSLRGASCLEATAGDYMTRDLQTCTTHDAADAVLARMTEGRFRHMPVVNDDGALIGIVTIGDAVKARLTELSMEKDALEGMITNAW